MTNKRAELTYYLMFVPALLLLIGVLIPFVSGVLTSLHSQKLYAQSRDFIFIDNYIKNFTDPRFLQSAANTFSYVFLVIVIQVPLGIIVALLLNHRSVFRKVNRSILVFPLLIPPIVSSLMWKTMMHPSSGVLNYLLSLLGIAPFPWLTGINTALLSLVLIDTWIFLPFTTLILLAGLQSLPVDLLEASRIDGASSTQVFRYIELPWIYPYIILVLLFRVTDSLKSFEIIYSTTRGGPLNATRTMNIMGYEEAFRWSNLGQSLSIVFCLWILAYVASSFLVKRWNTHSQGES